MKFNNLIPELSVSDLKKSLEFYTGLGFKIEYTREEKKFAMLSFQGSQIMIEQVNNTWNVGELEKPFGRGINFQITVEDAQELLDKVKKSKYRLFRDLEENWYEKDSEFLGCKEFLIQDPDGYLLRFSEDLGPRT